MGQTGDQQIEWLNKLHKLGFKGEDEWRAAKAVDNLRWLKRVRKILGVDHLDQDCLFHLKRVVAKRINLEKSLAFEPKAGE